MDKSNIFVNNPLNGGGSINLPNGANNNFNDNNSLAPTPVIKGGPGS